MKVQNIEKFFYTGKGDSGKSDLGFKKVSKNRVEIRILGDLDYLNSFIGVAKNYPFKNRALFQKILNSVQEDLFIIQAHVGCLMAGKFKAPEFKKEKVKQLEKLIDDFEKQIKPERGFVIPGASLNSAWLDLARTFTRKTELSVLRLKNKLEPQILAYLNRLSSLFFAMARLEVKKEKKKEKHPNYK